MRKLLWIASAVLALGVGLSLTARGDDDTNSLVGNAAPDFALKTADGQGLQVV